MESSRNCVKSLKDTLLEYAVITMDRLFTDESDESDEDVASIPIFPDYLFDEILAKSEDMCWPIQHEILWTCKAAKDQLKWSHASVFRLLDDGMPDDLKILQNSMHTLKTLKVYIDLDNPTDVMFLKDISKAADTLEHLELLMYQKDKSNESEEYSEKFAVTSTILKLKRLSLSMDSFHYFPFILDSSTLTMGRFIFVVITKSFLNALVGFKQLVHLSLEISSSSYVNMDDVIEAVVSLKGLRYFFFNTMVSVPAFNKIMKNMENLDILEIKEIVFKPQNRLIKPKKKLKVLNLYNEYLTFNEILQLAGLTHRIGYFKSVEGLMTIISTTRCKWKYAYAVDKLFTFIQKGDATLKMLTEAEKKGDLSFRHPDCLAYMLHSELKSSTSYDILLRILCYGINSCSVLWFTFVKVWIQKFIELNTNTLLAIEFTRLLEQNILEYIEGISDSDENHSDFDEDSSDSDDY